MVLKYHLSAYDYNGDLEVRIWEAQSDGAGAEVYTQLLNPIAGTHPIRTITVNDLDKVVHIVRLYKVATEELLHEYNVEPMLEATIFDPIYFRIGDGGANTPAAGTDTYTDERLQGLDENQYTIFRNTYGFLFFGRHVANNPGAGGFVLDAPDVFGDGEEFIIQMQQQIVNSTVNDSVVGKWFGGFHDINANEDYEASHLRKLLRFNGAFTYTFPAAGAIPIGYAMCFNNFGDPGNGTIKFLNGVLIWQGDPKNEIELKERCSGAFVWDGQYWNVIYLNSSSESAVPVDAQPGDLLGVGRTIIGDLPAGDPKYTVNHGLAIVGDYYVNFSVQSNDPALAYKDNLIGTIPFHWDAADKPNVFHFMPQEIKGEVQNITVYWEIKQF